jgi:hypothetical protein
MLLPHKIAESDTITLIHGRCRSDWFIYSKETIQSTISTCTLVRWIAMVNVYFMEIFMEFKLSKEAIQSTISPCILVRWIAMVNIYFMEIFMEFKLASMAYLCLIVW